MNQRPGPQPLEIILYVIGGIAGIYALWKGYIEGYYPEEVPGLVIAGLIAAAALLAASRLAKARQQAYDAARDRSVGVE